MNLDNSKILIFTNNPFYIELIERDTQTKYHIMCQSISNLISTDSIIKIDSGIREYCIEYKENSRQKLETDLKRILKFYSDYMFEMRPSSCNVSKKDIQDMKCDHYCGCRC